VARQLFARRLGAVLLPSLLVTAVAAGSAVARPSAVGFGVAPSRVLQGSFATLSVTVRPAGALCSLTVRYADGGTQPSLKAAKATSGRVSWRWRVAQAAGAGVAQATVKCGRAGTARKSILVVGQIAAPKVSVQQDGFSIRKRSSSAGITYGIVLANDSAQLDALDVSVLVNFVDAANRVVGTKTDRVSVIGAQSTFALGGNLTFPAAAIVDRLETVIRVSSQRERSLRPPAHANLRILANQYDPEWTGSIEGEIINDRPDHYLRRVGLSAVVFDAGGNVVGGTTGYASALLPPGARQFYKLTSGLSNVPLDKAASAQLSLVPEYAPL
jgi:hypothetical protein